MIKFALLGTGRIGKLHAEIINSHPNSEIKFVYDIDTKSSKVIAKKYNCKIAKTAKEAISSYDVDAILIASATPTHTQYITMGAEAGKAIFCEKPIDLDIKKVNSCWAKVKKYNPNIQIGFNRRYDPSHNKVQKDVLSGKIGKLEMIVITSRDPAPPGLNYLKVSGGIFRDCSIHDFDLARYVLQNDPIVDIYASGSRNVSNDFKKTNDFDTTMCVMKSKSGVLVHINNSRRAVYGYDQRLEVFGSKGMLISDNVSEFNISSYNQNISFAKSPIKNFFIERYADAYRIQFDDFLNSIKSKIKPKVSFNDGKEALILADCATKSVKLNKLIKIK
jgi:myo-inositol 2-dehydrogenase/D-chiro-inositol 1-dehydrogenase